jgi:thioredoxin-like negative regulator of GroEL
MASSSIERPEVRLPPTWYDGLYEAERGLWPSAAESFNAAANRAPDDPRPYLARAVCLLRHGESEEAIVLLETSDVFDAPDPEWRDNVSWLRAAARVAAGDYLGAENAAASLPAPMRKQLAATVLFKSGQWAAATTALLDRFGPRATSRTP